MPWILDDLAAGATRTVSKLQARSAQRLADYEA
jgi:hypothetical protein